MSFNIKKTTTPSLLNTSSCKGLVIREIGQYVVAQIKHLKRQSCTQRIHCADFCGSDVDFVSESMLVRKYHKGRNSIECVKYAPSSFEHCKSGPMVLSFNVVQEQLLLLCDSPRSVSWKAMTLQSGDVDEKSWEGFETMLKLALINAKGFLSIPDMDWLITQVENFSQIIRWSQKCTNVNDYICLTQLAYRLFTGDCFSVMVKYKIDELLRNEVQALDFGETVKILRGAFDTTSQIQDSPLMKKLVSLYSFLLTQGFLKRFGLEISDEEYSKLEQRALLSAFSSKKAFFVCVLDNVLFICEKINEWRQTGDLSIFLHSSDEYAKWLKEADRLLNLAPFVGNLTAHGTSYFSFLANLKDAIEKGEAYAKYTRDRKSVV